MKRILLLLVVLFTFISAETTQKVGSTYFHSNGNMTQKIGNTYFNNNGTSTRKVGNTFFTVVAVAHRKWEISIFIAIDYYFEIV